MLALLALAEIAQPPDAVRHVAVVGANGATVAERAEVLAGVEGEGRGGGERSSALAAVPRAVSLGGVLEHEQAVRAGDLRERTHVASLTVQMHGDDGRGARGDERSHRVRVDQAGAVVDVAKHRL